MAFRSIQPVLIDRGVPRIPNRYRKLVMSSNDVHSLLHLPGIIAIHIFMVQLPPIGRLLMSVSILAVFVSLAVSCYVIESGFYTGQIMMIVVTIQRSSFVI